jgi:hypothetical protein
MIPKLLWVKVIAIIICVDGMYSFLFVKDKRLFFQLARILRLILGLALFFISKNL